MVVGVVLAAGAPERRIAADAEAGGRVGGLLRPLPGATRLAVAAVALAAIAGLWVVGFLFAANGRLATAVFRGESGVGFDSSSGFEALGVLSASVWLSWIEPFCPDCEVGSSIEAMMQLFKRFAPRKEP